ncbi:odorant receptor 131-2-like [Gambusia affinis]|uniref:odorant receptor 131-2-like n=1 Tax=Gambusia affinis TaxID=33528 RepID=UPI001CDC3A52|nr:odorant receptor 131-2-like [Gambusia affinis]
MVPYSVMVESIVTTGTSVSFYVLLYNLLVSDSAQLSVTQVLFLLALCRVRLTYAVCGTITTVANLTSGISLLTLVIMSLERFVAVCYPLRHASIITIKNTAVAIVAVCAVSSLNNVTRSLFLIEYPYETFGKVLMKDYCTYVGWIPNSLSDYYDKAYNAVVFVSAGLTVISSYTGVVIAARAASADKASALKARKTLLLHLVQLFLSLSYTLYYPLLSALAKIVRRIVFVWVREVIYVLFIILPRCLTSLIYGLRDQTIRPVLLHYLFCRWKLS